MRITIEIDDLILTELKQLQRHERVPLGRLVSDLLLQSLASRRETKPAPVEFRWTAKSMGARFDVKDKHAVLGAMDTDVNDDR